MIYPTQEDIQQTLEAFRQRSQRVRNNPNLAREYLKSLEDRPLTTQPELTPRERSERVLSGSTNGANGGGNEATAETAE